jgi:hypothetical protein
LHRMAIITSKEASNLTHGELNLPMIFGIIFISIHPE